MGATTGFLLALEKEALGTIGAGERLVRLAVYGALEHGQSTNIW